MRSFSLLLLSLILTTTTACAESAPAPAVPAAEAAAPAASTHVTKGFADLAEKLLPAVVNISTSQKFDETAVPETEMPDMPEFPPGSPFEEFFRDFFEKHRGQMPNRSERSASLGSGFIISPDGLIVTNNHVIQDADEITVLLHDETNLKAKLLGRDPKTDIALLKVESKQPLPFVAFGDSDRVRVGDWVVAIGNPFGLGGTVTAGIISARQRNINAGPYDDFLQTDASINRGNSGGPMFNLEGKVIGVNTAIFSPSGGSVGIGFAIPAAIVEHVVAQLKEHGKIRRGWLGVRIQQVTEDIASSLNLDPPRGALVSSVTPDSPAAKAGILPGDVIIAFDGKEVSEMRRLPRMVAETTIGRTASLTVWRKGKAINLQVLVGELPPDDALAEDEAMPKAEGDIEPGTMVAPLGLRVAPLSESLRRQFDLAPDAKGLVVTEVPEGGLAASEGIQAGDVLVEAGQQPLDRPEQLQQQLEQAIKAGKPLLLLLDRGGDVRFVPLRPAKPE